MESETRTLQAQCLCGTANHEVTLKSPDLPIKGYICHCDSCRRMTGTMSLTVVFLPGYYGPTEAVLDKLTSFAFSKRITQYFCTQCGCHMLARCLKDGDDPNSEVTWDIATGTLERLEGIVDFLCHEHVEDTLDGGFADHLTEVSGRILGRWPTGPDQRPELPLYWISPNRPVVDASSDDKLQGRCKCGGVEFFVSRPSAHSAFVKEYWPEAPPADVSQLPLPSEDQTFYLRDKRTKFLAGHCSCNSCRLSSGMEITTWAFVPTIDITLDKEGRKPWSESFGTLKKYQSSPDCFRYFCGTCGAIVFYATEDRMWLRDIAIGVLMAPEGARAETWFGWRTSRLGFRDDAVPRAESFALALEKGLREWEERRPGHDLSGGSRSGGAL